MSALERHLNGFGLSLLVHGTLAGTAVWLWHSQPPKPEPEPMRWEISLFSPAPPAPAVSPADPAPEPQPDFDWLRHYLAEKIRQYKQYPGEARSNGWEGRVLVRAVIGGNGHLVEAEVVRSSGHALLDEEAVATLRRAMPVPVSEAHHWSQVAVTIPFDYRLRR